MSTKLAPMYSLMSARWLRGAATPLAPFFSFQILFVTRSAPLPLSLVCGLWGRRGGPMRVQCI